MRSILSTGLVAGFSILWAMTAVGQTGSTLPASNLEQPKQAALPTGKYEYRFISQHNIWSNRPIDKTAGKICSRMKDPALAETPYAVRGEKDWNSCVYTQIQSIGYMRWLQNDGFKASRKHEKIAKSFLERTYTMGHWGSYTLAELREAVKAAQGQ